MECYLAFTKNTFLENKAIQIQQVDKFHLKFLKCLNLVITKILENPDVKIKSISLVNLNKKYSKSTFICETSTNYEHLAFYLDLDFKKKFLG